MAGIGFSLRKLGHGGGFTGMARLYVAAGMISSGPWLISICAILFTGLSSITRVPDPGQVPQFQVSVTYLFAGSLILCGPLQLLFTRFIADRIFEQRSDLIVPNLVGAMLVVTAVAGILATGIVIVGFPAESGLYRVLMVESFVTLCNLWVVIGVLTGLKHYGAVLGCFVIAYGLTLAAAVALAPYGLEGLMAGFALGQALLLFVSVLLVMRQYPGSGSIAFGFLQRDRIFPSLAIIGFLFNLGVWIDKLLFWANPMTSEAVIGPLRGSYLYDVPVLLAYLAVVPGMAVFLVRLETDFAEHYTAFYESVRTGAPLGRIERLRDEMILSAKRGIFEIWKIQALALLAVIAFAPDILRLLGIPLLFLPLLYIDVAAVGMQVVLLAVLNLFFYLDQRATSLRITAVFVSINAIGTLVTQKLGYVFYGYGFAAAVTVASLMGLVLLDRRFASLVRDTFMLQGVDA